jgi:hypothetical protein
LASVVALVAVLQFQNRLYESQKLTLYLYIYYIYNIYINIEVFLGYGNSLSRTATLQRCNKRFQVSGFQGSRFQETGFKGQVELLET